MASGTLGARQEHHRPPPPGGNGNGRAPAHIRYQGGGGGASPDPARFWQSLGRTLRLVLLLSLIATALVATTFFDRGAQVLLLKASLVIFLSVLPGWLYLQFIALKGTVLYDEYVLNLYRLRIDDLANLPKPPPGSRYWREWNHLVPHEHLDESVARNIYLKKFEAVYGRSAIPESRRQRHDDDDHRPVGRRGQIVEQIQADAFSPVIMCTILLCLGWIAVLQPELYLGLRPFGNLTLSGFPALPVDPLRFGFLGAYVFVVQGLVRRYFHADLKTHAYVSAMARVILVAALVTAIHPLWTEWGLTPAAELAFAFFLGFFPELGLRVIQRGLGGVLRTFRPAREERYPLRHLDGVNIWTQARFLEEGIEDMQNLATANLVDLMLHTRMPINRLVDWIDQAFLYIRVDGGRGDDNGGDRALLRRYGIRTATDLLDSFEAPKTFDRRFRRGLIQLMNHPPGDTRPSVTEGIRRTLEGEVNLWHVRQWKKHTWLTSPATPGEAQSGEAQSREAQSGEAQSGEAQSSEAQSSEAQSSEAQSSEGLSGEGLSGEGRAVQLQAGDDRRGSAADRPHFGATGPLGGASCDSDEGTTSGDSRSG